MVRAAALSGGGVGVVAGAALQFPLEALDGGIEFAGSYCFRVGGPVSGGHEPGNLFGALLHGGQILFGPSELRNGEWVAIQHSNFKFTTTGGPLQAA
jgi:hypothetical protein